VVLKENFTVKYTDLHKGVMYYYYIVSKDTSSHFHHKTHLPSYAFPQQIKLV